MAKKDDIAQKLRAMLPENAVSADEAYQAGVAFSVQVPLGKLRDAATAFNDAGFYLDSLTALDFQDTFDLVYHFNCYEPFSRIVLHVLCGHDQAAPSVCDLFKTAEWQEREVREFFGITFTGNPDTRTLLLPEDADYNPLRKDFGKAHAYLKREEIYG
ncbi:MAG: NADH-quinone oxidoreductase subunit C [Acidobacteriota bacterium]